MPLSKESEERIEPLLRALELRPRNALEYMRAGMALTRAGDPRRAVDVLQHAVKLSPRHAQPYDELGFALFQAAKSAELHVIRRQRERMSASAGQKDPVDVVGGRDDGEGGYGDGSDGGSPTRRLERVPNDEDPCWRHEPPSCFPLEHYTREQLHIAEKDFKKRVAADDNDFYGFSLLATWYKNRSSMACATSLKLQPDRASVYLTLAHLLPRPGAVGLYRRALKLLPQRLDAYRELGDLLRDLRYYQQANTIYRHAIALEPHSHGGYHSLVELRLMRNRSDEAVHIAGQALALQPDAKPMRAGKGDKAHPIASTSLAMMAEARVQQQRYEEARYLSRAAVGLDPKSGRGYRHFAHSLYELDLPSEARRVGKIAAKLEPRHADTRYRMGMLLSKIPGRLQEAIIHFNGCLIVNEYHAEAKEASEAAQQRMHNLKNPARGGFNMLSNLGATLALLLLLTYFFPARPAAGWERGRREPD